MIGDKRTTREVRYRAYRNAVEMSLEQLLDIGAQRAEELAQVWWNRLAKTSAMKSGIFLHVEPLQTAAELLGVKRPGLNPDIRQIYRVILRESMKRAQEVKNLSDFEVTIRESEKKLEVSELPLMKAGAEAADTDVDWPDAQYQHNRTLKARA